MGVEVERGDSKVTEWGVWREPYPPKAPEEGEEGVQPPLRPLFGQSLVIGTCPFLARKEV